MPPWHIERHMSNESSILPLGNDRIDHALHGLISQLAETFPGRLRACYVQGSFGDGSALATSDLDLTLVFRGRFIDDEKARAEAVCAAYVEPGAVELDASVSDEAELQRGVWPQLKYGARLVYGEECRDAMPLLPIEQWTRDRMHTSYWRVVSLFGRPHVVRPPLDYPDPSAEFLGYTQRMLRLPDGSEVPCTRDLIRHTGWAATAIVAWNAGQYIASKRDCHRMYREQISDEYGDLLDDIYSYCRQRWQYLIPAAPGERQRLRSICERTLAFENHFLAIYKDYLLAELHSTDAEGRNAALSVLARVPFVDDEIAAAVRSHTAHTHSAGLFTLPG